MQNFSKILLIFTFITISTLSSFAQTKPPFSRMSKTVGHISTDGRFSILLPVEPDSQRQITADKGISGGMQYFWRTPDGEFFVTFFDSLTLPENPQEELEDLRDAYLSGIEKNEGKLLEKRDLKLGKNIGLEFKATLKSKEIVIIRYYLVNKRIYVLSTRLNAGETGAIQLKTLDSFKLIESKGK